MDALYLFLLTLFGFGLGWFGQNYIKNRKQLDLIISFTCLMIAIIFATLYVLSD